MVHEWGVQVLAQATSGTALAAPNELIAGLPKFVFRHDKLSPMSLEHIGWDKPVIHFYGEEELAVSVKVITPLGLPLAYYPKPELIKKEIGIANMARMIGGTLHFVDEMRWEGTLSSTPPKKLAKAPSEHWWNDAREIPSLYLHTEHGSERFLFYEATAAQEPCVSSTITENTIQFNNRHDQAVGPVLVLVNNGTSLRGIRVDSLPAKKEHVLSKDSLSAWDEAKVLTACREQWIKLGMTEEEAKGIVEIWKNDLLKRVGVMVLSPMPQPLYEEMFPIEITPKPDELIRVGLVFDTLPGQADRQAWLPGLEAYLRNVAADLAGEEYQIRSAARKTFLAASDLGLGVLTEFSDSDNPELRAAVKALKQKIASSNKLKITQEHPNQKNGARYVDSFLSAPEKD